MQGKRVDRVGQLVQQEMSRLILSRVKDPRVGFVTVTHVKMTADLKSAVVFISVMGDDKVRASTKEALDHARGFFQQQLGDSLKLRFTPRIQFEIDTSLERGLEIDRILRSISPASEEVSKNHSEGLEENT